MLRERGGRLRWEERDIYAMGDVIGPEMAERRQAPLQDSMLKAAVTKVGIRLDRTLAQRLATASDLRERLRAQRRYVDAPGDPTLFPRQRTALDYMALSKHKHFLLADPPGVGKTAIAIKWALQSVPVMLGTPRILVLCPNSAKYQWRRALRTWDYTFSPITIVRGTIAEQDMKLSLRSGWVIAHHEAMVHAAEGVLANPWDAVICDEAHWYTNRKAKRTATLFDISTECRLALTAHPYANSPDELFALLRFLYPDVYTSFWRFWGQHVKAVPKHFGGYEILGTRRPKLLRWELLPFMVRRTKQELGITEPSRIQRTITLPVKHRREYDRLRHEFFVELEAHRGERRILAIPSVLARVTRLRQFLVDPGLIGSGLKSLKYPLIAEIMDELNTPPVIFTSFKQAALQLQMYLKKTHRKMRCLTGGMTDATLEANKKAFLAGQTDGLIVVMKKGGESLNLGKYGNVIMLDMPWNAREVEQAEGRVDRPEEGTGLHVATTVFRCIVEQSYEVRLLAKIEKKHHMFTEVMSPRDLKELFA